MTRYSHQDPPGSVAAEQAFSLAFFLDRPRSRCTVMCATSREWRFHVSDDKALLSLHRVRLLHSFSDIQLPEGKRHFRQYVTTLQSRSDTPRSCSLAVFSRKLRHWEGLRTWRICTRRTGKLYRARSRLYRSFATIYCRAVWAEHFDRSSFLPPIFFFLFREQSAEKYVQLRPSHSFFLFYSSIFSSSSSSSFLPLVFYSSSSSSSRSIIWSLAEGS